MPAARIMVSIANRRLAVDRADQGRRLGELLLLDAARRMARASAAIAVYALVVDAKNEKARSLYEPYGFRRFPDTPSRLLLTLDTFLKAGL